MIDLIKFTLRVSADLHKKLNEAAKKEGRSMHAHIIYILTNAVK